MALREYSGIPKYSLHGVQSCHLLNPISAMHYSWLGKKKSLFFVFKLAAVLCPLQLDPVNALITDIVEHLHQIAFLVGFDKNMNFTFVGNFFGFKQIYFWL